MLHTTAPWAYLLGTTSWGSYTHLAMLGLPSLDSSLLTNLVTFVGYENLPTIAISCVSLTEQPNHGMLLEQNRIPLPLVRECFGTAQLAEHKPTPL